MAPLSLREKLNELFRSRASDFFLADKLAIKLADEAKTDFTNELDRLVPGQNALGATPSADVKVDAFESQAGLTILAECLRILEGRPKGFLFRRASKAELDRARIASDHSDSVSYFFRSSDGEIAAYYFFETLGYRFTILAASASDSKSVLSQGLVLDFRRVNSTSARDTKDSLENADRIRRRGISRPTGQ